MKKKSQNKRLVYSKNPLRLTTLGTEVEGEMLMALEAKILTPLRRQGFSDEGILLTLWSAVKNLPDWLMTEEVMGG